MNLSMNKYHDYEDCCGNNRQIGTCFYILISLKQPYYRLLFTFNLLLPAIKVSLSAFRFYPLAGKNTGLVPV